MQIRQITSDSMSSDYGISCQKITFGQSHNVPFQATWCEIPAFGATEPHAHGEYEQFIIIQGKGVMRIEALDAIVTSGTAIEILPGQNHQLQNTEATPLVFLSVYSNHRTNSQKLLDNTVIYAAPLTPNGKLHVGHLAGPYLAADILHRYYLQQNFHSSFVTGTDDFQNYVSFRAQKENHVTEKMLALYRANFVNSLKRSGISPSINYNPASDNHYQENVVNFFNDLKKRKSINEKIVMLPYCEACSMFLVEAYLSGNCKQCHQPMAGNICEVCTLHSDLLGGIANPACRICQTSAVYRESLQYIFDVSAYREQLSQYYDLVTMSASLRHLVKQYLSLKQEFIVTYPSSWGISISNSQAIHVWFEMAAAQRYYTNDTNAILFFGIDNGFYYSYFIPALLLAQNIENTLPKAFVSNEFYQLGHSKFSTSRNHAVWADELLNDFSSDIVRWYLSFTRPESSQTSFDKDELQKFQKDVFEDLLYPWLDMITQQADDSAVADDPIPDQFLAYNQLISECYQLGNFRLSRVAWLLKEYVRDAYSYTKFRNNFTVSLQLFQLFLLLSQPVMPKLTAELLDIIDKKDWHKLPGTLLSRFQAEAII